MRTVDVLIIGAGPSGSSCAISLLKGGRECLLIDKYAFPRVKLCGGLFTHKGQEVLKKILGQADYCTCMQSVVRSQEKYLSLWRGTEKLVQLEPQRPIVLVDRPAMDDFLVRYYQSLGGQLIEQDGLKTIDFKAKVATLASGEQIKYNQLVAADGTNSIVKRLLTEGVRLARRNNVRYWLLKSMCVRKIWT